MKRLKKPELKEFLDEKAAYYNAPFFIAEDPVSIPHLFSKKEDIEIAAFLVATISWGQRKTILRNANTLLTWMDQSPYDFITNFSKKDLVPFKKFVHRTFNGEDTIYFLHALQKIYREYHSLEALVKSQYDSRNHSDYKEAIHGWRNYFLSTGYPVRTAKHFANPVAGSAAKRINMFLRWMIRKDKAGVDFGIWKMDASLLTCPLDVHSGRVARKLGLLERNQNDWQAAAELTAMLKTFDPNDPVKYDFALFGLGVYEKF